MKKRIIRDLSTAETQAFWASAERIAAQAEAWPASKRAGINVAETRAAPPDEADRSFRRVHDPFCIRILRRIRNRKTR